VAIACALALLVAPAGASAIWIDPPTFTPVDNPGAQLVDGGVLWIRPGSTGAVRVDAVAGPLGVPDQVVFPDLGPGWTPRTSLIDTAFPWSVTYDWDATALAPGTLVDVVTTDLGGGPSAHSSIDVRADSTAPYGSLIDAHAVTTRDSSAPVTPSVGTDYGTGIDRWQVLQRTSPSIGGACPAWQAWQPVGAPNPATTITADLPAEGCYQFALDVADRVGNVEHVEQVGVLHVDRSAPLGSIDPVQPREVHGGASVVITGSALDTVTSIRSASLVVEDRYSVCSGMTLDPSGRWSCTWNIDYAERTGPATLMLSTIDEAGNRASFRTGVEIKAAPSPFGPREEDVDRVPPIVGLARIPLISWADHVDVRPTARDDRDGFVEIRMQQRTASVRQRSFGRWMPATFESEEVVLEERGETTCFRAVAVDLVGNVAYSAPRCTTLPLDDVDLRSRAGEWDEVEHPFAWLRTMQRSTRRGAALEVRIADPTPQLVVARCPGCGRVSVFHGTRRIATFSTRASKRTYRRIVNLPTLRNPASAPLRIVAADRKPVYVDALVAGR
jgi:hypothetical protein